jgi:hypothetical protein
VRRAAAVVEIDAVPIDEAVVITGDARGRMFDTGFCVSGVGLANAFEVIPPLNPDSRKPIDQLAELRKEERSTMASSPPREGLLGELLARGAFPGMTK